MLINTNKMLKEAYTGKYAVGAFNVNNMEIVQAISEAAQELHSPVIMQASLGAVKYTGQKYLKKLVEAAVGSVNVPISLHLDHGENFDICKKCIDNGFTSVMVDGSALSFEDNIKLTKKVVDYAHEFDVTVEGELGRLCGVEDDVSHDNAYSYTDPYQAAEFIKRTNVDSLAVAIGTSHGAYKFKNNQIAELKFDILEKIELLVPDFPIVLHGASSVSPEYIHMINTYGGKIEDAFGIPEEMIRKSVKMAVCKINIDSDLRLAMTATIRKYLTLNKMHFDPRQYLGESRLAVKEIVKHKIKNVLGSDFKIKF